MITSLKNKRKGGGGRVLHYMGAVLLVIILIALVVADVKMYKKRKEFLTQTQNLQKQIKDIKATNDNLNQGISQSDNSQYIEKIAREQLDLQKPGEKVVSFIAPPDQTLKTNTTPPNGMQIWLGSVWNLVTGK